MPSFPGVDYIEFDSLLSDEEKLVRQSVRRFVDDAVMALIEKCQSEGRVPRELVPPMAELGYLGAQLEGYGCAGMSAVEYGLVMPELGGGDPGLGAFAPAQGAV